jgi:hypothetical protein
MTFFKPTCETRAWVASTMSGSMSSGMKAWREAGYTVKVGMEP